MVNDSHTAALNDVFRALANPARRTMLARLVRGDATVSELGRPLDMTAPAVTKHLHALESAGLVERAREGRVHRIHLRPVALSQAAEWLAGFWSGSFDALAERLEGESDGG